MTLEEFFQKMWFSYPNDLCHGKKGSKVAAMNACKKLKENEFDTVLANIEALKRYDRKDQKPDRWPHVSTFINQAYYDRDIGSTIELKEKLVLNTCAFVGCDSEVIGERYRNCAKHLPRDSRMDKVIKRAKYDAMNKRGLLPIEGEDKSVYAKRCRDSLPKDMRKLLGGTHDM